MLARIITLASLVLASGAMAQTKDHAPVALQSSSKLEQDKPNSESWTYIKPNLRLGKYDSVLLQPTAVYSGADAQFGSISQQDRQKFATMVTGALDSELRKSFALVPNANTKTLKLRVTLLGAETTKGGVATATRLTTFGLAANALKSAAGKPGTFTGSILYAVEVNDGATNELLAAGVRRRSPDALDIPATFSTSDTIKSVARDLAEQLRQRLERARAAN